MEDAEADCKALIERLHLYLDGEIVGVDCAALERHLRACPPCVDRVGFERDVKALVRKKCSEEVPADLADRLRAHIRRLEA